MAALDQDGADRSKLADRSKHGASFDKSSVFEQNRGKNARDGRPYFKRPLVGLNFNQGLVEGDRITGSLEPSSDR